MNKRLVWHDKEVLGVLDLMVNCKDREGMRNIFDRILTTREINDIARRYKVLTMLDAGLSYADIKLETGMSATAISRLSVKCGFGFRKSSGLREKSLQKKLPKRKMNLRYKGVQVR